MTEAARFYEGKVDGLGADFLDNVQRLSTGSVSTRNWDRSACYGRSAHDRPSAIPVEITVFSEFLRPAPSTAAGLDHEHRAHWRRGGIARWCAGEAYANHRHDTHAVGLTDCGVQVFGYRVAVRASTPGRWSHSIRVVRATELESLGIEAI